MVNMRTILAKYFVKITILVIFVATFILTGCDTKLGTDEICNKYPELCHDLHKDSWCRFEKGDLIRNRYLLKNTPAPTDQQLYHHLINLENYFNCIDLASGVQHILHPERTNDRLRAQGMSALTLAELQQATKNSGELYQSYYHWSRFNLANERNLVLSKVETENIDDVEILAAVALYYLKVNQLKAHYFYLKLFELANSENLQPEWLLAMAELYQEQNELETVYLLSRANLLMTDNPASEIKMLSLVNGDRRLADFLDSEASDLIDVLKDGEFSSSPFYLRLSILVNNKNGEKLIH